jgi:cell division protein FtsB
MAIRSWIIRGAFLIFFVLASWIVYQIYREMERNQSIQDEIVQLQTEGSKIRQENASIRDRIAYFKTDDFQEKEAKEKLNYQEEGERVTIIKPSPSASASERVTISSEGGSGDKPTILFQQPSYQKWWQQFFDF